MHCIHSNTVPIRWAPEKSLMSHQNRNTLLAPAAEVEPTANCGRGDACKLEDWMRVLDT